MLFLGGGIKTALIAMISPTAALPKSQSILKIFLKAMNVVNHQAVNQKQTAYIGIYIVNDSIKIFIL